MAEPEPSFGGWDVDREAKRRRWLAMTPGDRLRWLEEALTFAAMAGALDRDRARRAEEARAFGEWLQERS